MELDLNKFRTLIPISALYDDSLLYLAAATRVERMQRGDVIFDIGDRDKDSVFLMSGEICEFSEREEASYINAGSDEALYALANFKPRQFRAEVISDSATIARVDARLLEKLLAWGQFAPDQLPAEENESDSGPDAAESEWMMHMLQSTPFLKLPAINIQTLFSRMQEVSVRAGELVVRMSAPGDFYYIIKAGRCKVWRPVGSGENVLAELGPYDSFGEEALISEAPRNANVSMSTDGLLMRLYKDDFTELMEEPLLDWVDAQTASTLLSEGALRVDVRLESEFAKSGLPGAINIPLHRIRSQAVSLDKARRYILYCDTGQRSSAGAFLLGQMGFDAKILKGGISGV